MRTDLRRLMDLAERTIERECPEDRPSIRWHFRDHPCSSGTTYTGSDRSRGIAVTLGTDQTDAKIVILHEIAHWLTPEDKGHGSAFWEVAFRLYRADSIGWGSLHARECVGRTTYKGAHVAHLAAMRTELAGVSRGRG